MVGAPTIFDPFIDIAVNIVESKGVGRIATDRFCLFQIWPRWAPWRTAPLGLRERHIPIPLRRVSDNSILLCGVAMTHKTSRLSS